MTLIVGVGLLAALTIFESIRIPPAVEPVDTSAWLAAAAGDTLIVTDVTGRELSGDVIGITPDTLSVWTPAGELRIDRGDVRLVRHRFADPLGDGTSKGLWAGVASAVLMYVAAQSELGISDMAETVSLGAMAGILVGGGMAIGRGVDSMVASERVIYRAPSRSRTTLAPLLSKDAIGAGVRVTW